MHFHTTLSDWKKSNEEILKMINPKNIDFLAVTEHDIVNSNFKKSLDDLWIPSAYSVKVSACDYSDAKSMHILHYSSQINDLLNPRLESIRNARKQKIQLQVQKLIENGFDINYDEIISYYQQKRVNVENLVAYHIAHYIYRKNINLDKITKISGKNNLSADAFYKAFMKRWWEFADIWHVDVGDYEFDIEDFNKIRVPNSIISLAHPNVTFKNDIDAFAERIAKLVPLWINAIEVNPMATKKYLDVITYFAHKYDLILSFWSDCHFSSTFDWKHWQLFHLNQELSKKQIDDNLYRIKDKLDLNWVTNEKFETQEFFKKGNLAVMIGRMNPPHIGHLRVIRQALRENNNLVIFLGSANVVNEKNPFDFEVRWKFLEAVFSEEIKSGKLILSYLDDCWDDGDWTENLWEKLKTLVPEFAWILNFYGWDFKEDRAINAIRDYEIRLNIENVNYIQVERDHFTLPNGLDISATNLRNALNSWDFELAKKFMDDKIAPLVIKKWEEK